MLAAEYTWVQRESDHMDEPTLEFGGWSTYAQLQFARRWWAQARWENLDVDEMDGTTQRFGAMLAFVPSEFQSIRLEWSRHRPPAARTVLVGCIGDAGRSRVARGHHHHRPRVAGADRGR